MIEKASTKKSSAVFLLDVVRLDVELWQVGTDA
jgi:hypothetical protein